MRRTVLLVTAAATISMVASGCSPSTQAEQKTENANAAVCLGLKSLGATIQGLTTGVTGSGDVTVGQAQEAINQISEAYDNVQAQTQKLQGDVANQVEVAQEQFDQAQMQVQEGLSGLDGDQSMSDVPKEELKAIDNLNSSYEEMSASIGCSDASQ